ncbi:MAG: hypothetical protein ACLFVW_07215 [Phycisphaerae bacterium]
MAHIRGIGQDEIETLAEDLRLLCVITLHDLEVAIVPQQLSGMRKGRVNLNACSALNSIGREGLQQSRIESAGSYSGIEEAHLIPACLPKSACVRRDLQCQRRRRCELAQAIAFSRGLAAI